MAQHLTTDRQYKQWVIELKNKIGAAQIKVSLTVNRPLLELYWELGREIYEKQQTANWGEALIEQLSRDLTAMFPDMKGFSKRNLFYIRKWFLFYQSAEIVPQVVGQIDGAQKVPQVVAEIPWGHNREIITKCKEVSEALFYVRATIANNWSRAVLVAQMESRLYVRSGKTINNFDVTLSKPQADLARETLKNLTTSTFSCWVKMRRSGIWSMRLRIIFKNLLWNWGRGLPVWADSFQSMWVGTIFTSISCFIIRA
jgi:predicted nuclease of restriction endonuclease-like (RecB) superfamily